MYPRRANYPLATVFALLCVSLIGSYPQNSQAGPTSSLPENIQPTVYPYLLDPTIYPDYTRRPTLVPTWNTFNNKTQFVALRHLPNSSFLNQGLGTVCWPNIGIVRDPNLSRSLDELKRRGYYLFDIGGYVPQTVNLQIKIPPATLNLMNEKLGDHFLGIDNGENDARYLFIMRQLQAPYKSDRVAQSEQIYDYFSRIGEDLGERMDILSEYWYWSYPLKEGNVVLTGAETQNRVTSSSIQYAFLRGAGKQYGIPWFGNVATFSTWDYKSYDKDTDKSPLGLFIAGPTGPNRGNSLSLMRRLLWSHYLYNSVILSYEGAMYMDAWWSPDGKGELSPLGKVQQDAVKFVDENEQPGVMQAPVALLLDYYAGWVPARTLTTAYQVWGYLPYEAGDYLTHSVLELIYPDYEDCGWYHDETGTLCDTPYGDMTEVIHSDAAEGILNQYGVVFAAGNLFSADLELRRKLERYVSQGGTLVLTAENARRLFPEWKIGPPRRFPSGSIVTWRDGSHTSEPLSMDLCPISLPQGAQVLAQCGNTTAVAQLHQGSGSVIVLLSPFGINAEPIVQGNFHNSPPDQPLPQPHKLLDHVQRVLDSTFRSQRLFSVGDQLGYITCRKGPGDYTLGIFNNSLHARPFQILSYCGLIKSITELKLGRDQMKSPGYWPRGFQDNDGGISDSKHIAGGDVRLFSIKVNESNLRVLPQIRLPERPAGRLLALSNISDLAEEIRHRPTFFEHFDGAKVDWSYFLKRDPDQIKRDRIWLDRQKLQIVVDFTSGLNGFPGLTLIDLLPEPYTDSVVKIDNVLDKMQLAGITNAIIGTHRAPELGATPSQINESFARGLKSLCDRAKARGITLYLENRPGWWHGSVPEIIQTINEAKSDNLKFALNTFATDPRAAIALSGNNLGMVLVSAPLPDIPDSQGPISKSHPDLSALKSLKVPLILDGEYTNPDDVFRDTEELWSGTDTSTKF